MQEIIRITTTNPTTQELFRCWFGLSNFSACSYNPFNPPILFSLGEAVAALGLILAAYQLQTLSWRINLKIRGWWYENSIFIFSFIGLFFALAASFVSQIPPYLLPAILKSRILFELLSAVSFGLGVFYFISIASKPTKLFNKKNAERFYRVIFSEASRLNPANTEVVVNLIKANLPELCAAVRNRRYRFRDEEDRELTEDEWYSEYASAALNVILSENAIARYIATERLDFIHLFVWAINKFEVQDHQVELAFEYLLEHLFSNKDSYLYRQEKSYAGLALGIDIYDLIFSNKRLVSSFDLFQDHLYSYKYGSQISVEKVEVFLKALEHSLKIYWSDKNISASCARGGLRELNRYLEHLKYQIHKDFENSQDNLLKISHFLGNTYVYGYKEAYDNKTLSDWELTDKGNDKYRGSVNATYAESLYQYLECLAGAKKDQQSIMGIDAHQVIHGLQYEPSNFENVRTMLLAKIWEQIAENVKGFYPNILRVYLAMMDMYLYSYGDKVVASESWIDVESKKLLTLLHNEVLPKLIEDKKMANKVSMREELLPNTITFENDKLYITFSETKKELPQP